MIRDHEELTRALVRRPSPAADESRAREPVPAGTAGGAGYRAGVLNTHHHGDHTWGSNSLYPQATIIGHERCRDGTLSGGLDTQQFFPTAEFGHIDVVPAFATFTVRLDVYVDDLSLELHYVGPAHITNDVVAWIPGRRLMFTGDIAFNGGTEFIVQVPSPATPPHASA